MIANEWGNKGEQGGGGFLQMLFFRVLPLSPAMQVLVQRLDRVYQLSTWISLSQLGTREYPGVLTAWIHARYAVLSIHIQSLPFQLSANCFSLLHPNAGTCKAVPRKLQIQRTRSKSTEFGKLAVSIVTAVNRQVVSHQRV